MYNAVWDPEHNPYTYIHTGGADFLLFYILFTSVVFREVHCGTTQPPECGWQHTLNSIHGHTAARLQSNGNLAV